MGMSLKRRVWPYLIVLVLAIGSIAGAAVTTVVADGQEGVLSPIVPWLGSALLLAALLAVMALRDLRKARRAASLEAQARMLFATAADRIAEGVAVYDADLRLKWCNSTYLTLLGPQVTALGVGDAMPPDLSAGVREMRDYPRRWVAVDQTVLDGGEILSTIRDVTALKEAEERERTSHERFRESLAAAGGWIWESDVLHRFSVLTPVRPEVDPSDIEWLTGRKISELLAEGSDGSSATESCLHDMEEQRRIRDVALWFHDGRRMRSVRLSGVPRFDSDGTFLGYRGVGSFAAAGVLPEPMPRRRRGAPIPAMPPRRPQVRRASVFRRLLVAEDSPTNRALASSILARMGYEVDTVEDGRQAVEAVRSGDYGAVLMDVWMPKLDGLAATAAIRSLDEPKRSIPIVAMTAHASQEDRQRCLDAGMDDHIAKPIDRARLLEILENLLDGEGASGDAASLPADGPEPGIESPPGDAGLQPVVDDSILEELRADAGPALVDELIGTFMDETQSRLDRMGAALDDGRLDDIGADAHAMKSSSGTFGALRLESLAARLEAASMGDDGPRTAELMRTLPDLVAATRTALAERGYRLQEKEAGA